MTFPAKRDAEPAVILTFPAEPAETSAALRLRLAPVPLVSVTAPPSNEEAPAIVRDALVLFVNEPLVRDIAPPVPDMPAAPPLNRIDPPAPVVEPVPPYTANAVGAAVAAIFDDDPTMENIANGDVVPMPTKLPKYAFNVVVAPPLIVNPPV